MNLSEMLATITKMQNNLKSLNERRNDLLSQVSEIDEQIKEMGGDVTINVKKAIKRGRKVVTKKAVKTRAKKINRAKNDRSLISHIVEVLGEANGNPMRIKDIVTAVEAKGYVSSGNLYSCVAVTIANSTKVIKTGRGLYTLSAVVTPNTVVETVQETVTVPVVETNVVQN